MSNQTYVDQEFLDSILKDKIVEQPVHVPTSDSSEAQFIKHSRIIESVLQLLNKSRISNLDRVVACIYSMGGGRRAAFIRLVDWCTMSGEGYSQKALLLWKTYEKYSFSKGKKRLRSSLEFGSGVSEPETINMDDDIRSILDDSDHAESIIRYWASVDNPDLYMRWAVKYGASILEDASPLGQSDWARVLSNLFKHKLVYTSMGWYTFNGDRWVSEETPVELYHAIAEKKYLPAVL